MSALRALAVGLVLLSPERAHASNLWIAFETGADRWRSQVEDFFACVTGATNFNTVLHGYGAPPVVFAGDDVVPHCGTSDATCARTDIDCVIAHAAFAPMIRAGDVVLYINTGPCGGWNDRRVSVTIAGASVAIHWGEVGQIYAGTAYQSCQTAAGMHEVFESATNGISADCCNHQVQFGGGNHPECAAPAGTTGPALYGEYTLRGCAGQSFRAQTLSPAGQDYTLSACTELTVDTTSLCAQPRAARDVGVCTNGNVERCTYGSTVESCNGDGCTASPTPHCSQFGAQCELVYPAMMCSGMRSSARVTCTNTGEIAWDGDVQLGSVPQGRANAFTDSSWISPSVAADVVPVAVAIGAMAAFDFTLHAPAVSAPTPYRLSWALVRDGAYQAEPPPDALSMAINVAPCSAEPGTEDGGFEAVDASGGDIGAPMRAPGCGCRTMPQRDGSPWTMFVAGALAAVPWRRRMRRGQKRSPSG